MRQIITRLARSKSGATAIEYGLIVAMIAIAILTAVTSVADETTIMWGDVEEEINNAVQK